MPWPSCERCSSCAPFELEELFGLRGALRAGGGLGLRLGLRLALAVGRRLLAADGAEALLERRHQVRRLGRLGLLARSADDLLARRLALEQVEQLLAVLVAIVVGLEVAGQGLDQLLGHLELALLGLLGLLLLEDLAVEVLGRGDLVVEAHRGQGEDVVHRADRGQMLLVAEHEAGDRDLARLLHRLHEQRVGARGALVGTEVVGLLEVDRVDVVEIDEVLDLDRAGPLRVELGELVAAQDHVLVGRVLVALDDLLVGDLLAVGLGDPLVLDPRAVALTELAEAHGLLGDRAVELHGHVEQPEADRSTPYRPSHAQSPRSESFDIPEVTPGRAPPNRAQACVSCL